MEQTKIALFIVMFCIVQTSATYLNFALQQFLIDNGHRHVNVFHNSSKRLSIPFKDIYLATIHIGDIGKAHDNSFGIFMFDPAKDDLKSYLSYIVQRRVKMSLLTIFGPWKNEETDMIKKYLSDLQASTMFYISLPIISSRGMTWHQVVSLKSGSSIDGLVFVDNSLKILETYDLKGLEISSTSLTWDPYLIIEDCNEYGLECGQNEGYMIDYMDRLAKQFNFTFVSQRNVDNDWGTTTFNGTRRGVWADVMRKQYDMSLSIWFWTLERNEFFDFVPIINGHQVLAMKPRHPIMDFGLFMRPFAPNSHLCILLLAGVAWFLTLFMKNYVPEEHMEGLEIMAFIGWLFFTLIFSYYCGVMTMFFTSPISVPFTTLREVIRAYPDWNFIFGAGSEKWCKDHAKAGDPDFMALWQRYLENPTGTTFNSVKHGIELIENEKNVIWLNEKIELFYIMRSNASLENIHTIRAPKVASLYLILQKNSPLLPIFNLGVSYLRESGLDNQLINQWFGGPQTNGITPPEGHILTFGQMITIFLMMLVVFVVAPIVLCGEVFFKSFIKKEPMFDKKRGSQVSLHSNF